MTPHYEHGGLTIYHGDCREVMAQLPANSVDAIVSDPPYGISFMGRSWDHAVPGIDFWKAALRVVKPGGHMCAFGGTRLYHRLMCAIEDAGWEIRDCLMWVYGGGFPKSHDVSQAIDKHFGVEREVVGTKMSGIANKDEGVRRTVGAGKSIQVDVTVPATVQAQQFAGYGTALKPAWEPIILVRKPIEKGKTIATNVLKHGTGGLNIGDCRVGTEERYNPPSANREDNNVRFGSLGDNEFEGTTVAGRWPANVIHDGSDEVVGCFPDSESGSGISFRTRSLPKMGGALTSDEFQCVGDKGSAARFFYSAKAQAWDRGEGNKHPTVKPRNLMRYLCKLIGGQRGSTILDPFSGSFSTILAAHSEGFKGIGIDADIGYCEIGVERIAELFGSVWEKLE